MSKDREAMLKKVAYVIFLIFFTLWAGVNIAFFAFIVYAVRNTTQQQFISGSDALAFGATGGFSVFLMLYAFAKFGAYIWQRRLAKKGISSQVSGYTEISFILALVIFLTSSLLVFFTLYSPEKIFEKFILANYGINLNPINLGRAILALIFLAAYFFIKNQRRKIAVVMAILSGLEGVIYGFFWYKKTPGLQELFLDIETVHFAGVFLVLLRLFWILISVRYALRKSEETELQPIAKQEILVVPAITVILLGIFLLASAIYEARMRAFKITRPDGVYLRSSPQVDRFDNLVAKLPKGTEIIIEYPHGQVGRVKNTLGLWWRIRSGLQSGFVFSGELIPPE